MKIQKHRNIKAKKQDKNETQKSSKAFFIIFGLFIIVSTFNLVGQIGEWGGLKPFGFIENTWAAVRKITGIPAPNTGELLVTFLNESDIYDSPSRCEIIDPNLDKIVSLEQFEAELDTELLGENMAGINQGPLIGGVADSIYAKAKELGMSYVIAIATNGDDGTVSAAQTFMEKANAADLMPIIRLCFVGSQCDFKSADKITDFYRKVEAVAPGEFVAMLGPNEPGTGTPFEMEGFIQGIDLVSGGGTLNANTLYNTVIDQTNAAARELQSLRENGKIKLSPGAFNLTNTQNNDVTQYFYESDAQISPGLYDYLMGNTYELGQGRSAYDYYENGAAGDGNSLKKVVDRYDNLNTIITEFGVLGSDKSALVPSMQESYQKFCDDEKVAGVLFYRNIEGLPQTEEQHSLPDAVIKTTLALCAELPEEEEELDDYAWQNCNLDSCVYEHEFEERSVASVCGVDDETDPDEPYYLRVLCGNDCSARRQLTLEVSAPIKQFGSNLPSGVRLHDYIPISQDIAVNTASLSDGVERADTTNDPFNQFAGKLMDGSDYYPMPWLGSAINNSSELIKGDRMYVNDEESIRSGINANPGSKLLESIIEQNYELNHPPKYALERNQEMIANSKLSSIIDEKSICKDMNPDPSGDAYYDCTSADYAAYINEFSNLYDPTSIESNFKAPEQCEESDLFIREEDYNYIIGPEVVVEESENLLEGLGPQGTTIMGGDVCRDFGVRNLDQKQFAGGMFYYEDEEYISCEIVNNPIQAIEAHEIKEGGAWRPLTCGDIDKLNLGQGIIAEAGAPEFFVRKEGMTVTLSGVELNRIIACANNPGLNMQNDPVAFGAAVTAGTCEVTEQARRCVAPTTQQGPEGEGEVYYIVNPTDEDFAEIPEYEIPGIYDSVYQLYKRNLLITSSSPNFKRIVLKNNIGWELKASAKVRDVNRELDPAKDFPEDDPEAFEYLYDRKSVDEDENEAACEIPQLIDNSSYLAKGDPIRTDSLYYDWLGVVDLIQEFKVNYNDNRYFNDSELTNSAAFWQTASVNYGILPEELRVKNYLPDFPLKYEDPETLIVDFEKIGDDQDIYSNQFYDLAAKHSRYPMFTCDSVLRAQIEYLNDEENYDFRGKTLEDIREKIVELELAEPSCISLSTEDNGFLWSEDKLAEFLCAKGYEAMCYKELECAPASGGNDSEEENPDETDEENGEENTDEEGDEDTEEPIEDDGEENVPISDIASGATCPLAGGFCLQGPGGTFSHETLPAVDIMTNESGADFVAPFDGKVVSLYQSSYCVNGLNAGYGVIYESAPNAINGQTVQLFVYHLDPEDVNNLNTSRTYRKGDRIADMAVPGVNGVQTLTCQGIGEGTPHLHVELRGSSDFEILGLIYGLGCQETNYNACDGSATDLDVDGLICNDPTKGDGPIDLSDPSNNCNEFNCFIPGADAFETSLDCAGNTVGNSVSGNRPDGIDQNLADVLDWYGPFCDTEIRVTDEGEILESLPFGYNWSEIYDGIASELDEFDISRRDSNGNVCTLRPPDANESVAYDFREPECNEVGLVTRKQRYPEAYEFYRGAFIECGLSQSDMTWTGSVGNASIEELADKIRATNYSYQGTFNIADTPDGKIEAILTKARSSNINPFILIAIWGTESAFGQSRPECNVFNGSGGEEEEEVPPITFLFEKGLDKFKKQEKQSDLSFLFK